MVTTVGGYSLYGPLVSQTDFTSGAQFSSAANPPSSGHTGSTVIVSTMTGGVNVSRDFVGPGAPSIGF